MTQPDGLFPTGAANYSSLSEFASKTQTDWESSLVGDETDRWTQFLDGLFGDMPGGQPFILTLITEFCKKFLGLDPTTFFATIEDAWNTLEDWANQVWGWFEDGATWLSRLITDLLILVDFFHLTYPAGAVSDTETTTSGGKRTWYSAWYDLQDLFGVVQAVPAASDPAPTIGPKVTTAENTVIDLSAAVQELQTNQGGADQSNAAYSINFNQYADGSWPSADFPLTYSGSGTGYLEISGGNAVWHKVAGADRAVVGRYKDPTNTDYQEVSATIAGLPEGSATNYACVRMNSTSDTYTFGRVYLSGFSLNWEFGYFLSGTKTVLASGSGAPLNFGFKLKAGIGGDPYRFQGISGNTVVFDYTDSAHATQLGAGYRYFGFRSETANNGNYAPAPASYIGCFDDSPADTMGSGVEQYSTSAGVSPTFTIGTPAKFPSGFFDITERSTVDLSVSGNAVTVSRAGWYEATIRTPFSLTVGGGTFGISPVIFKNGVAYKAGSPSFALNGFGSQYQPDAFGGSIGFYAAAGDVIEPGFLVAGGAGAVSISAFSVSGDANGIMSIFSLMLSNR